MRRRPSCALAWAAGAHGNSGNVAPSARLVSCGARSRALHSDSDSERGHSSAVAKLPCTQRLPLRSSRRSVAHPRRLGSRRGRPRTARAPSLSVIRGLSRVTTSTDCERTGLGAGPRREIETPMEEPRRLAPPPEVSLSDTPPFPRTTGSVCWLGLLDSDRKSTKPITGRLSTCRRAAPRQRARPRSQFRPMAGVPRRCAAQQPPTSQRRLSELLIARTTRLHEGHPGPPFTGSSTHARCARNQCTPLPLTTCSSVAGRALHRPRRAWHHGRPSSLASRGLAGRRAGGQQCVRRGRHRWQLRVTLWFIRGGGLGCGRAPALHNGAQRTQRNFPGHV